MRISFEFDDLLVLHDSPLPGEVVVPWWWRWRYPERMRRDAKAMLQTLHAAGHEPWIYTTSLRQPRFLLGWFKRAGIPIREVIDQHRHDQAVNKSQFAGYVPSKYPPAFGIDLHVDHAEGVAAEGAEHGFRVVVAAPTDADWVRRVLEAVDALQQRGGNAP